MHTFSPHCTSPFQIASEVLKDPPQHPHALTKTRLICPLKLLNFSRLNQKCIITGLFCFSSLVSAAHLGLGLPGRALQHLRLQGVSAAEQAMHQTRQPQRSEHLQGYPLQSTSMGVDIFFSLILSYFWRLVAALRPCQGSEPRLKYMST